MPTCQCAFDSWLRNIETNPLVTGQIKHASGQFNLAGGASRHGGPQDEVRGAGGVAGSVQRGGGQLDVVVRLQGSTEIGQEQDRHTAGDDRHVREADGVPVGHHVHTEKRIEHPNRQHGQELRSCRYTLTECSSSSRAKKVWMRLSVGFYGQKLLLKFDNAPSRNNDGLNFIGLLGQVD